MQWSRGTTTPSLSTGATKAASGRYFYFLETSSGMNGDISYLQSPKLVSGASMTFYYHMHGATMRTLSLQALSAGTWRTVWSKTGQQQASQSDPWRSSGVVNLPSGTTQVRFSGMKGTSYTGDMSVDNIVILQGSGGASPPPPAPPLPRTACPKPGFKTVSPSRCEAVEDPTDDRWYSAEVSVIGIPSPFVDVASFQLL